MKWKVLLTKLEALFGSQVGGGGRDDLSGRTTWQVTSTCAVGLTGSSEAYTTRLLSRMRSPISTGRRNSILSTCRMESDTPSSERGRPPRDVAMFHQRCSMWQRQGHMLDALEKDEKNHGAGED
jgi:hypothetical protein